ncbi:MAG: hypothetical protein ACPGRE_09380 [Flavobacteriaceae bacterium]
MELPKFLLGDHSDHNEDIFVIHCDFPRFIINLKDDDVEMLEDLVGQDQEELEMEMSNLIEAAGDFYDEQMKAFEALD